MIRRHSAHVLSAFAITALATLESASAAPPRPVTFFGVQKTPLLYFTTATTIQEINQAPQTFQWQAYIFRDGTVLSSASTVDASTYGEFPSRAQISSKKLTPGRLAQLLAVIRAAKPASQPDCSQRAFPTPGQQSHDAVFTWFGNNDRQNTFMVRQDADQNCPNEVYPLLTAALSTVGDLRDSPTSFAVPPVVITPDVGGGVSE
jgi:hypothetical protein